MSDGKPVDDSPSRKSSKGGGSQSSLTTAKEADGEELSDFNLDEWDASQPAYDPELINLKMKQNRVTVFKASRVIKRHANGTPNDSDEIGRGSQPSISSATTQMSTCPTSAVSRTSRSFASFPSLTSSVSSTSVVSSRATLSSTSFVDAELMDKAELVGNLVAGIVRAFLERRRVENVQINLSLVHKGTNKAGDVRHASLPGRSTSSWISSSPRSDSDNSHEEATAGKEKI